MRAKPDCGIRSAWRELCGVAAMFAAGLACILWTASIQRSRGGAPPPFLRADTARPAASQADVPADLAAVPEGVDDGAGDGADETPPAGVDAGPPAAAADVASQRQGRNYPWRENIVTTVFWVGEYNRVSVRGAGSLLLANRKSAWDPGWLSSYGGADCPRRRDGYAPAGFSPRMSPFYVALPYNDIGRGGRKPEAASVIPWFRDEPRKKGVSALKGRWVAIRRGGRVCYAQWEDVGPFRSDHWQYVFGTDRPSPNLNRGAGLDVSPAVRDFLGMGGTGVTDWRFVDDVDVPKGPWNRVAGIANR